MERMETLRMMMSLIYLAFVGQKDKTTFCDESLLGFNREKFLKNLNNRNTLD